jgi:hypothetical protein
MCCLFVLFYVLFIYFDVSVCLCVCSISGGGGIVSVYVVFWFGEGACVLCVLFWWGRCVYVCMDLLPQETRVEEFVDDDLMLLLLACVI